MEALVPAANQTKIHPITNILRLSFFDSFPKTSVSHYCYLDGNLVQWTLIPSTIGELPPQFGWQNLDWPGDFFTTCLDAKAACRVSLGPISCPRDVCLTFSRSFRVPGCRECGSKVYYPESGMRSTASNTDRGKAPLMRTFVNIEWKIQ